MQRTFLDPSTRLTFAIFLAGALMGSLLTGCGEKAPHLDTTTVTSPVGRPGICEHCKKKIDNVTEEHLIIVRGNQYIVCDEKCAADLKDWLAKQ